MHGHMNVKFEKSFIFAANGIVKTSALVSLWSYPATESRSAPQNNRSLLFEFGTPWIQGAQTHRVVVWVEVRVAIVVMEVSKANASK